LSKSLNNIYKEQAMENGLLYISCPTYENKSNNLLSGVRYTSTVM